MIYRSNLTCPDLTGRFKLKDPPLTIMGHDMPSDPDYEPGCGYWTHDEGAILFHVAQRVKGTWLDIGSRFGWTGAHIIAGGADDVWGLDPMYADTHRLQRARASCPGLFPLTLTSEEFFKRNPAFSGNCYFSGVVIDGNHDSPEPLRDAISAAAMDPLVIAFHDFQGPPVQDAVEELMQYGWACRVYDTPNGVAVCWHPDRAFTPPDHVPDPAINWAVVRESRSPFFNYARCV